MDIEVFEHAEEIVSAIWQAEQELEELEEYKIEGTLRGLSGHLSIKGRNANSVCQQAIKISSQEAGVALDSRIEAVKKRLKKLKKELAAL